VQHPILASRTLNSSFHDYFVWFEGVQGHRLERSGTHVPLFPCMLPYPDAVVTEGETMGEGQVCEWWSRAFVNTFMAWGNFVTLGCPRPGGSAYEPRVGYLSIRAFADKSMVVLWAVFCPWPPSEWQFRRRRKKRRWRAASSRRTWLCWCPRRSSRGTRRPENGTMERLRWIVRLSQSSAVHEAVLRKHGVNDQDFEQVIAAEAAYEVDGVRGRVGAPRDVLQKVVGYLAFVFQLHPRRAQELCAPSSFCKVGLWTLRFRKLWRRCFGVACATTGGGGSGASEGNHPLGGYENLVSDAEDRGLDMLAPIELSWGRDALEMRLRRSHQQPEGDLEQPEGFFFVLFFVLEHPKRSRAWSWKPSSRTCKRAWPSRSEEHRVIRNLRLKFFFTGMLSYAQGGLAAEFTASAIFGLIHFVND